MFKCVLLDDPEVLRVVVFAEVRKLLH
jgi:hypothetical protein